MSGPEKEPPSAMRLSGPVLWALVLLLAGGLAGLYSSRVGAVEDATRRNGDKVLVLEAVTEQTAEQVRDHEARLRAGERARLEQEQRDREQLELTRAMARRLGVGLPPSAR